MEQAHEYFDRVQKKLHIWEEETYGYTFDEDWNFVSSWLRYK